jgi:hypothetical protein
VGDSIFSINLEGEITHRFKRRNEREYSRNVAYDTSNDWIWICESRSDIYACNVEGDVQTVINLDGGRTYGIAYWEDDPDGFPLYLITRLPNNVNGYISKINPRSGNILFVASFNPPSGTPRGAFISSEMDDYSTVIVSVSDISVDDGGDRIDIWQIYSNSEWMTIDPTESVLSPNDEQDIFLSLDASGILPMRYPAEIVFSHNAVGGEMIIPIDLTVVLPDEVITATEFLPQKYSIREVYPNPFNSTVRIKYSVPMNSSVSIKLYDITGSLVDEIVSGVYLPGIHTITWDATRMPSGVYFARMKVGEFSQSVKLLLVK